MFSAKIHFNKTLRKIEVIGQKLAPSTLQVIGDFPTLFGCLNLFPN